MKVLGGLRLGEGSAIGNITLPVGPEFPGDENLGELFYLKGHNSLASGIYICEDVNDDGILDWRLLLNIDPEELLTRFIELGSTEDIIVYGADFVALRWDYQSFVDSDFFAHNVQTFNESSKVHILQDGYYQISYTVNSSPVDKAHEQITICSTRLNGNNTVGRSVTVSWAREDQFRSTNSNTFVARLSAGDYIEIMAKVEHKDLKFDRAAYTIGANCGLSLTRLGDL